MKYLQTSHIELQRSGPRDDYARRGIAFVGAPRKHPYDPEKIILVVNPFSRETDFYELRLRDILHVEERSNLVSESGESVQIAEIWVRRGGLAVKFEPFVVGAASPSDPAMAQRLTEPIDRPGVSRPFGKSGVRPPVWDRDKRNSG